MIVTLGTSLVDGKDVGGEALEVAIRLSKLGLNAAYIGSISSDEGGRLILDSLIDNIVFFEPHLCGASEPTASPDRLEGCACSCVTEAGILDGFESIADLQCLFIDATALAVEPGATAIERIISTVDEDVRVVVSPHVPVGLAVDEVALKARLSRLGQRIDMLVPEGADIPPLLKKLEDSGFRVEALS